MKSIASAFAISKGRHPHMFLEKLAHKRLVGEMQLIGNFLDALRGISQLHPQLLQHIIVNPLVGCAMADLLHRFRQVFGRDAKLPGIPPHSAFMAIMQFHQADEFHEDSLGTTLFLTARHLYAVDGVVEVIDHGRKQHAHHIFMKEIAGIIHLFLDQAEIAAHPFHLVRQQPADGMNA